MIIRNAIVPMLFCSNADFRASVSFSAQHSRDHADVSNLGTAVVSCTISTSSFILGDLFLSCVKTTESLCERVVESPSAKRHSLHTFCRIAPAPLLQQFAIVPAFRSSVPFP
jgi:hypothetical protein